MHALAIFAVSSILPDNIGIDCQQCKTSDCFILGNGAKERPLDTAGTYFHSTSHLDRVKRRAGNLELLSFGVNLARGEQLELVTLYDDAR